VGLQVELEDLLFQPLYEHGSNTWGDARVLKLGKLRIKSLRADRDSVRAFLEGKIPGLRISGVELDKTAKLRGRMGGLQFSSEVAARIEVLPPALCIEIVNVQLGESRLPDFFLAPFRTFLRPLTPMTETPFAIEAPGLTLSGGWLSIP